MSKETCRVLLIGECFSNNLGDAIICECVRHLLLDDARVASVDIVDLSGRTAFQEEMPYRSILGANFKLRLRNSLLSIPIPVIQSLIGRMLYRRNRRKLRHNEGYVKSVLSKHYDLAVFAGGQLFYEPFLVFIEHFQEQLAVNNIPIIFNACGYGTFTNSYAFARFGALLNRPNVQSISVRDHVDLVNSKWLKSARIKAQLTFDPAAWCNEAYSETKIERRSIIGIGVIYIQDESFMKKQTEMLKSIVQKLDALGIAFQLFGNGYINDDKYARELATIIDLDSMQVAPRPTTPDRLIALLGSFNVILSSRLHSHIIANSLHIPSLGIAWDEKIPAYFARIDANDRCFNVSANTDDIVRIILQLKKRSQNNVAVIETDLKHLSREVLIKSLDETMP